MSARAPSRGGGVQLYSKHLLRKEIGDCSKAHGVIGSFRSLVEVREAVAEQGRRRKI